MKTLVAVAGATGTMGTLASDLIDELDDFEQVASLGSGSALEDMLAADLLVDFTIPSQSPRLVHFAVAHGLNALVGTSGWSAERIEALNEHRSTEAASGNEPGGVIIVPNFSLGSVVATSLATVAARFFGSIEIVETHGPRKVDSPSGTAVRTAELIAQSRAGLAPIDAPHAEQRARGETVAGIPVHSRRLQGMVAAQEVVFGGTGETLSIRNDTYSPASYRAGLIAGLRAARTARGITVGLDTLINLSDALTRAADLASPSRDNSPAAAAAADPTSGPARDAAVGSQS